MTTLTLRGWLALELALLVRDGVRGNGSTRLDQGTRRLIVLAWIVAFVAAELVAGWLGPAPRGNSGGGHLIAGLVVMWAGLAVRIWAILVLGRAFRTTVEVDPGQGVVDRGPYRWVRHPSYNGTLVISTGVGLTLGNCLSLAIMLLLPLAAMLRRISVEETALTEVLGQPYQAYQARTKRLVPGLW
jgi:protein-S-isoprenylcysteine O-methyltransferase Ste14